MKKLKLSVLLFIFTFSSINSSEQQEMMQGQTLWLETKSKKLFFLYSAQISKYPVLNYYVSRFGYANSCNTPLKIESKKSLDALISINLDDFFKKFADKKSNKMGSGSKLEYAITVSKELCGELGKKIVRLLQRLTGESELSMVVNQMMFQKRYFDDKCFGKIFFNNKKNYWDSDDEGAIFYDHNDKKIFATTYDQDFISAYNNSVILLYDTDYHRDHITIYDLATQQVGIIPGSFSEFQISPDGHYVALRSNFMINTIQIYDIRDIAGRKRVALIDHINLCDFTFSPDSSKLISWTNKNNSELVLWDLEDIEKIKEIKKILLPDIECSKVQFNQDNEHICAISCNLYNEEGGIKKSFDEGCGVIININTNAVFKLPSWYKAQVFCDNSDLIVCQVWGSFDKMTKTKDTKTKIFTKFGKKLQVPECVKDFSSYITADYIFMSRYYGVGYLFDHQMNLITYLGNENVSLKLDTENNIVARDILLGDLSYWPIPPKERVKSVESINAKLTVDQFVCLEMICLQKRQQKEFCILQEGSSASKVFKTFGEDEQSFLKEQLFIQ